MKDNQGVIKIGLMGLSFESENLGCVALAYSFYSGLLDVLDQISSKVELVSFSGEPKENGIISTKYPIHFVEYHLSNTSSWKSIAREIKSCDVIVDFTEGDSFSDIYGNARFIRSVALKLLAIHYGVKLILGPQTYGPYNKWIWRKVAKYIINHAECVFSRDEISKKYLEEMQVKKSVEVSTDVAYLLPYHKSDAQASEKKKLGINISGLLFEDGRSGNNTYKLKCDYIEYCKEVIEKVLQNGEYEIFLIPHVGKSLEERESDYAACHYFKGLYPECVLSEGFTNPIDAKTVIAQMDIFIGARMHATIGAFSSKVFTIPFAYSRKFEGYYSRINYPVLIDGCALDTKTAVERTLQYIENAYENSNKVQECGAIARQILDEFYNKVKDIIEGIN